MTVAELVAVLSDQPPTRDVVVAGYGRLALVTWGGSEDGKPVCVLYVEEAQEPETAPVVEPEGQTELPL